MHMSCQRISCEFPVIACHRWQKNLWGSAQACASMMQTCSFGTEIIFLSRFAHSIMNPDAWFAMPCSQISACKAKNGSVTNLMLKNK